MISRGSVKSFLGGCNFVNICSIVAKFSELNPNMFQDNIIFTPSNNYNATRWRKVHISGFESRLGMIQRDMYIDFVFNAKLLTTPDVYKSNPFF